MADEKVIFRFAYEELGNKSGTIYLEAKIEGNGNALEVALEINEHINAFLQNGESAEHTETGLLKYLKGQLKDYELEKCSNVFEVTLPKSGKECTMRHVQW